MRFYIGCMSKKAIIHDESVISKIYFVRGHKVMLDEDLAELYGVETKNLKKAVRRNLQRFPNDFMFELSVKELQRLRFQFGTSKTDGRGGTRYTSMAFTEQGVAMLSTVLNSERAVLVNIHIIRVFTKMREMLSTHKDILLKLEQLEKTATRHDGEIQLIFDSLKELLTSKKESKPIGFQYN